MSLPQWGVLALIFLGMIFLNRMLAVPQQVRLNRELTALKRLGSVCSVGLSKSLWGTHVGILIGEKDGTIQAAYRIRGWSVISGYQQDKSFPYGNCNQAVQLLQQKPRRTHQEKAYLSAATYMQEGLFKNNQEQ